MTIIDQEIFLKLSTPEVANLVRAAGPQVCIFPINGTRRWFALEHAEAVKDNPIQAYLDINGKQHIKLYHLCFEHGLDTILTPMFGSAHSMRSGEYMQKVAAEGMARLTTHPDFLSFYQNQQVRVHFYGNYRKQLADTPYSYLIEMFDRVTRDTRHNNRYRLFYGIFANDATETIAELSVQYFQQTGKSPTRDKLVELYYGEYLEPASLFIGFSKLKVYDYPLLGLGEENLYFTVAPSLYLNTPQLRNILYDHIYLRRINELDYAEMPEKDFLSMRRFYQDNLETTIGIGELHDGMWYPILQTKNNLSGTL
jgi:tuberculosinol/isotuberculosinol synthase